MTLDQLVTPVTTIDSSPVFHACHEGGGGDLLVSVVGAGVVEVNDVLVGVDPGDDKVVIGLGALVAGVPDDRGIDPGDDLAVVARGTAAARAFRSVSGARSSRSSAI